MRGLRKVATICRFEFGLSIPNSQISHSKASNSNQNEFGSINIAPKRKKSLKAKITLNSEVLERKVTITIPIRTVSELNCSENRWKKSDRHKAQRGAISRILGPLREKILLPCHMHLVRYAPRKLDAHDNLPASLKYIVDSCCAVISGDYRPGKADSDKSFSFSYGQETCSDYGVKIEFTF